MNKIYVQHYQSPVGELILGAYQDQLCLCDWRYRKMRDTVDQRVIKYLGVDFEEGKHSIIDQTIKQLQEFFQSERQSFTIPLLTIGTDFQKTVWQALQSIPFGQTETYLELSKRLGNEKAIRAVASANGANALSILIPCHRIVGSNGELTGYAGGIAAKKALLQLEGAKKQSSQLDLFA